MEPTSRQVLEAIQAASAAQLSEARLSHAVAAGIKDAMSDPAVWSAAVSAIQSHAKSEAGGWLFGGLKTMLSRIGWAAVIVLGIYVLGGWSAVVAFVKSGHP